jgi:3-deoxy-7-phosphoheptulonate synthase
VIIVMSHNATKAEIDAVVDRVHEIGLKSELSRGEERTLVGVIGGNAFAYKDAFSHLGGIHEIIPITKPFKLASREFRRVDTIVDVGGVKIGGDEVVIMAGCTSSARWRLQAAHLALLVPGSGRICFEDDGRRTRRDRAEGRDRGHRPR